MAAAAMAMARAAAMNPADLLANPAAAAALMAAAQPPTMTAAAVDGPSAPPPAPLHKQNGNSSPISDRGSPPVSPVPAGAAAAASSPALGGVINLTKANGDAGKSDATSDADHDINVDEDDTDEEVKNIVKA